MILNIGEIVITPNGAYEWLFDGYIEPWPDGRDCRVRSFSGREQGAYFSKNLLPAQRRYVIVEKALKDTNNLYLQTR